MLETLTRETFEPLIGEKFTLTLPDERTFDFALVDVVELPAARRAGRRAAAAPPPRRVPFSIYFTAEPLLPQAMYPMQHDALGKEPLRIFIVPIGQADGGGYEYEAVFT